MKKIFTYTSYKNYLKDVCAERGRGTVALLADAAGCNRTYLSQCLSSKVQLTPDHVFGISDFLNLNEDEQEFFLLLLLNERSASRHAQLKIRKKMEKLIQNDLVLSKKINQKSDSLELSELQKMRYYSTWKYAMIHILTSIKEYQLLSSLSKKTRLSETEVSTILKDLAEMGLVSLSNGKWQHSGRNIHVPTGSLAMSQNHLNWRLKSIEDANNKNSIHYSTLFSLSVRDIEKLKNHLLEFIDKQRDLIHKSGSEELVCFCCDLFEMP